MHPDSGPSPRRGGLAADLVRGRALGNSSPAASPRRAGMCDLLPSKTDDTPEEDIMLVAMDEAQDPWSPPPLCFLRLMQQGPKWLHSGRWSPVAPAFVCTAAAGLAYTLPQALSSHPPAPPSDGVMSPVTLLRGFGAAWSAGVLARHLARGKQWTLSMYTVFAWVLAVLHLGCSFLAAALPARLGGGGGGPWGFLGGSLRFTAAGSGVLVVLTWWGAMVPIFRLLMPPAIFAGFWRWNLSSFTWLNFHGLFLPLLLAESRWGGGGGHSPWELWVQVALALLYLVCYLSLMVVRGWQWYPFLSPRTHWCGLVYAGLLGGLYGIYAGLNSAAL